MNKNSTRIICVFIIFFLSILPVFSQPVFSGSVDTNLAWYLAFPYEDDRFDTLINPGNFLNIHDIQFTNYCTAKLEGSDDTSAFALWFGLDAYQIAEALFAAAAGDDIQTMILMETLPFLGTEFNTIELLRANISFYVTEYILFKLGRQQMHTGYGYGWNPIDFAGTLKDPYDPEAELKGTDAVKMTLSIGNSFQTSISGVHFGSNGSAGIDYKHIILLSESKLWLPGIEVMLNGLYEYDEDEGEDTLPDSLGMGCKVNLFDIGIYGEAAARFGSRNRYYDSEGVSIIKTDTLLSFLAGIEYMFPNELMVVLEYFYNGEGLGNDEKDYYKQAVESSIADPMAGYPTAEQISMIIPGYINKQYILCHMLYPIYDLNMDAHVLALFSPDGLMLNLLPGLSFHPTGSLTLSIGYTGLFDFDRERINEASLSPVKHIIEITGKYYF